MKGAQGQELRHTVGTAQQALHALGSLVTVGVGEGTGDAATKRARNSCPPPPDPPATAPNAFVGVLRTLTNALTFFFY